MTKEEYDNFIIKQAKLFTNEINTAIVEQNRLHEIAIDKMSIRDEIHEKYINLFSIGFQKLNEKYPDFLGLFPSSDIKNQDMKEMIKMFISNNKNNNEIRSKMNEISEIKKSQLLLNDLNKANYEFYNALADLNEKIALDREQLFTEEYKAKLDFYADNGLLLYFLETPDIPILDEEINESIILDMFIYNDCIAIETMIQELLLYDTPIMQRKSADITSALDSINVGYYRSAARDMFALIESEHKRCANLFEGYFSKAQEYKKGIQRSKKIGIMLNKINNIDWERHSWDKIDQFYKKLTAKDVTPGVCNRNGIIHGDYENSALDITAYDCIKLVLLWINMRLITDKLTFLEEEYDDLFSSLFGYFQQRNENKSSTFKKPDNQ